MQLTDRSFMGVVEIAVAASLTTTLNTALEMATRSSGMPDIATFVNEAATNVFLEHVVGPTIDRAANAIPCTVTEIQGMITNTLENIEASRTFATIVLQAASSAISSAYRSCIGFARRAIGL